MRIAVDRSSRLISPLASSDHSIPNGAIPLHGEVIHAHAEIAKDLLHGDTFPAAPFKPNLAFHDTAAVLVGDRLGIGRSRGNGARNRIEEQEFHEAQGSGALIGSKTLQQR
jgi:hypothetical protein